MGKKSFKELGETYATESWTLFCGVIFKNQPLIHKIQLNYR